MSEDRSSTSNDQQSKSWFERLTQAFNDEPKSRKDIINLLEAAVSSELIASFTGMYILFLKIVQMCCITIDILGSVHHSPNL